jgi:hypothetical protein
MGAARLPVQHYIRGVDKAWMLKNAMARQAKMQAGP